MRSIANAHTVFFLKASIESPSLHVLYYVFVMEMQYADTDEPKAEAELKVELVHSGTANLKHTNTGVAYISHMTITIL